MLVSVNDVANRLKISNRAVQIKCKREGVVKIGNQYQITNEILDKWINNKELKQRNETETNKHFSYAKTKTSSSFSSFVIILLIILLSSFSVFLYINLDTQIKTANQTIKINNTEYKKEVNKLNEMINNAQQVIYQKDLEIQSLKLKDSLRFFKRY